MSEITIVRLKDILNSIQTIQWNYALYLEKERPWNGDSRCLVLDPNDVEDQDADEPQIAIDNNLRYALLISDAQDVVLNAQEQLSDPSDSDLVNAFNYYYENDAFIRW